MQYNNCYKANCKMELIDGIEEFMFEESKGEDSVNLPVGEPPIPATSWNHSAGVNLTTTLILTSALVNDDFESSFRRNPKVVRSRHEAWSFVLSWTDELFQRQFRISRKDFFEICENALRSG